MSVAWRAGIFTPGAPTNWRYVVDHVTNARRAEWGLSALADFVPRTGVDAPDDAIGDLMTNLLHLARGYGLDTDRILSNAAGMMATEVDEDEEGDMVTVQDRLSRMFGM